MYAFSVDNFKRSPAEVAALMALFETKLHEMLKVRPDCPLGVKPLNISS